jgi:hypothetical protein
VYTGKSGLPHVKHFSPQPTTGQGEQAADMSWWPKHLAWVKSGLNVGYWSTTCEVWYQKWLEAIRSGAATLRTASDWKASIKFAKKTQQLVAANQVASEMYLNGRLNGTGQI